MCATSVVEMLSNVKCDFLTNTDRVVLIHVCAVVYDTLQIDFYLLKLNKIGIKAIKIYVNVNTIQ